MTRTTRRLRPARWNATPKAAHGAEAEFLAIGDGAGLWLAEAAAAGTSRVRAKMARAVQLAAAARHRGHGGPGAGQGRGSRPVRRRGPGRDPGPPGDRGRRARHRGPASRPPWRRAPAAGHATAGRRQADDPGWPAAGSRWCSAPRRPRWSARRWRPAPGCSPGRASMAARQAGQLVADLTRQQAGGRSPGGVLYDISLAIDYLDFAPPARSWR